jgi:sortase A
MIAPAMRRFLRILSVTLITAGLVILADAGITVLYKEPLSSWYNTFRQRTADDQLAQLGKDFLGDSRVIELGPARDIDKRAKKLAGIYVDSLENGKPMGRLDIPSIGVNYAVIEGTDEGDLQKGPGHYPTTALPGQGRTIGIAGHRTTYGAPFNQIDGIDVGDEITIEMPYADFTYTVTNWKIVDPTDVQIVDDVGRERLVLTACHPLYSAAQRYAVFADLTDISLFPGGTGTWKAP